MKCRTCKIETMNKMYCSINCSPFKPFSYKTHSRCRKCAKWWGKDVIKCSECNYLVSHNPRLTSCKNPDRWLKAY
jgi:hypothetical protein